MHTIYERIAAEYQRIKKKCEDINKQLKKMPKGELMCIQDGTFQRWYLKETGQLKYISKSKRELAEKLAAKKYLTTSLKNLNQEKKAIEFYIRHHKPNQAEQFLNPSSPYYELLFPYFEITCEDLKLWSSADYDKNTKYPEQLIYKTSSGNLVRSKSEMLIDTFLHINKVPFRYECALDLGEIVFYPDFTVKHPKTGVTYYWEHFGMMDDAAYCKNTYSKLQLYSLNGIVPGVNLIMTFETREHPLSSEMIEKIIEYYFT